MLGISKHTFLKILLASYSLIFIWSLIKPFGYLLWTFEVAPAIIGIILCLIYYKKVEFSTTTYLWCFIAACLMTVGAHYSYSEVPLFNWLQIVFNWQRNNYDKLGHIVQGILPVLIAREILIKQVKVTSVFYINLIAIFVSMAITAGYEIIEWGSVYFDSCTANDFLGAQGYIWDTQTDMLLATIGALLTLIFGRRNLKNILISNNH